MSASTPPPPPPAGGWQAPPPYPPPQQPGPPRPTPPLAPSTGSGMAVASVALSLTGFLLGWLASLPGVVLGFVARRKAAAAGRPTGAATAGIVIGFVSTFTSLILGVLVAVPVFGELQSAARQDRLGEQVVAAAADANQWYAATGNYNGWAPEDAAGPGAVSVSLGRGGTTVCLTASDGADAATVYASRGRLMEPVCAGDRLWAPGTCGGTRVAPAAYPSERC